MTGESELPKKGMVNRLPRTFGTPLRGTGVLVTPHGGRTKQHPVVHALHGLRDAWLTEPNMRLHVLCAWVIVTLGVWMRLSRGEWLGIIVAIAMVVAAELVNTALEHVIDLVVGLRTDPVARYVKDAGAGAVLIAAVAASVIGGLVFIPHIVVLIRR